LDLKFCEVEEIPLFSMKIHSVSILCARGDPLLRNLRPLSDHSQLVEGGRERGMGLAVPKEGNAMIEVGNKYTQAVRKAKASFFKQKFASCSTNSKKFWDTVKSMENKSTSSQLPTALRLGNTVTTDKSTIIKNFNKHFSTAGHAFHLATPTPGQQPERCHGHPPLQRGRYSRPKLLQTYIYSTLPF
jgi:hypothetical protein